MEEFFYIGSKVNEVALIDLMLRRYGTLTLPLSVEKYCEIIMLAIESEVKENRRKEWLAMIPTMMLAGEYMTFDEYYEKATGKNIDMRPTDVIIAEIDAKHAEVEKNGSGDI